MQIINDIGMASEPVYISIEVEAFNDPPQLFLGGDSQKNYSTVLPRGANCVPVVDHNARIVDEDSEGIQSIEISFLDPSSIDIESERLEENTFGVLVINSSMPTQYFIVRDENSGLEDYNAVLPEIQYCNDAENPREGTRIIRFQVLDKELLTNAGNVLLGAHSEPAFTFIDVQIASNNEPPTLEVNSATSMFVSGTPTQIIDPDTIQLQDPNGDSFSELIIFITNSQNGLENELITFEPLPESAILFGPIITDERELLYNVSFNSPIANNDTIQVIQSIRYTNRAQNITLEPPREICLQVKDSEVFSERACVNVTLTPIRQGM